MISAVVGIGCTMLGCGLCFSPNLSEYHPVQIAARNFHTFDVTFPARYPPHVKGIRPEVKPEPRYSMLRLLVLGGVLISPLAIAQMAGLRPAPPVEMPGEVDSNSPAQWRDGQLELINSAGTPAISSGGNQFTLNAPQTILVDSPDHFPMWIESTWVDADGTLYGWYHHEPKGICGGRLTVPRIGALVSYDSGATFHDLGIVLEAGDAPDCSSQNGFFAGGHGDFSVIPDRRGRYFYFLFGNYGGDPADQGIAIARMAFEDRINPAGAVWKHFNGSWDEPGLGGRVTPIFRAGVSWQHPNTEALWGPSVHWNTFLRRYVVLMNHVCCEPEWPRDGVFISFNRNIGDPEGWTAPEMILQKPPDYYPQVLGTNPGGTDTRAGETARLYVHGKSQWEIVFRRTESEEPPPEPDDPYPWPFTNDLAAGVSARRRGLE
jgi:hypothetical protein